MAGVRHADVDLCMIYDSFTITVLLTLENLGFCKTAKAVPSSRAAGSASTALPVNTDGGGLSSNHPGMRGIFLVIEAVKQLRGECGARQVKDARSPSATAPAAISRRHSGATLVLGSQT